jgi:hypothetical protein
VLRRSLVSFLVLVAVGLVGAAPSFAIRYLAGSPGAGDPFFPFAGNGGYDVRHYSLRLDYEPQNNALDARAVIPRAPRRTCRVSTLICAVSTSAG